MSHVVTVGMLVNAAQTQGWVLVAQLGWLRIYARAGVRVPIPWIDERLLTLQEWEALIDVFGL